MTSRRHFLTAGAAGSLLTAVSGRAAKSTDFRSSEIETRIARRDFRDLTKDVLPTPSMVIDQALFDQNVQKMANHCKTTGINIRPHVKIHKSVDVAKRQIGLGAIGLTTATIAESELMSGAGLKNVLWTKQPAGVNQISRTIGWPSGTRLSCSWSTTRSSSIGSKKPLPPTTPSARSWWTFSPA